MIITYKDDKLPENEIKIVNHVKDYIIPLYEDLDLAHGSLHIKETINNSIIYAGLVKEEINTTLCFVAAAYHDIGLLHERKFHEYTSAQIFLNDIVAQTHLTEYEMKIIADAIADHRSHNFGKRRSIYGQILADADHTTDPETSVRRMWFYRSEWKMNDEQKIQDVIEYAQKLIGWVDAPLSRWELNLPEQIVIRDKLREVLLDPVKIRDIINHIET